MDNLEKARSRQKAKSEKAEKKKKAAEKKESSVRMTKPRRNYGDASLVDAKSKKGINEDPSKAAKLTEAEVAEKGKSRRKRRRRKKSKYSWLFNIIKIMILLVLAGLIAAGVWIASIIDPSFGDDLSSMNLNISSKVYYVGEKGENLQYAQFNASQNRVWMPIDKIPANLQNAIVAIEDQRFYNHRGFDLKRTTGAAMNYLFKGDSSYGGSTITQQLVKNITEDKSRDASRKIREITRAVVLETKLSKEQILELYLNTIYLSQGANGVEAAANIYFSKSVSELSLSECACIAGITQYPAEFDPITHPEANENKRKLVLKKMYELDYVTKAEYDEAIAEKVVLNIGEVKKRKIQSYFLDHLFEEVQNALVKDKGYTKEFAGNMIYNGGLRIHSTVDPRIQTLMEEYFENDANFARLYGDVQPQAAMIISDPKTGEIKGIVGGRGEKNYNRGLNRATQTKRQPGSSIKPIAVYGPAIDMNLITASSVVDDSPLMIEGWKPKNSGGSFRGNVSVRTAVMHSYNIPAVRVLEALTIDKSFEYMKKKLHVNSLVELRKGEKRDYTDKAFASLALGGLTDGVTVLEMNGAYSTFANDGRYIEPHTFTTIYDVEGKIILENKLTKNKAFTPATAFQVNELLKSVVMGGTGAGAQIPNMDTCGKTGTTDSSKDRWFVGYTPYYVASVWYGYDDPRPISAGGNPALYIWKDIMLKVHEGLPEKRFEAPESVEKLLVCTRSGFAPGPGCPRATQYADKKKAEKTCEGNHTYIGTKAYAPIPEEEDEEKEGEEETSEDGTTEGEGGDAAGGETTGSAEGGETGSADAGASTSSGGSSDSSQPDPAPAPAPSAPPATGTDAPAA